MRDINEVIIHCTATRPNWWEGRSAEEKVREVRQWHLDRGWSDVGYHYLIDRDGSVVPGRPVEKIGAHVKGHNKGTIGVALFGGHGSASTDQFSDHFTQEQADALTHLLAELQQKFPSINKISGHNDYTNAKSCPGFKVDPWLRNKPAPKPRTSLTQSKTIQASQVTKIASAATPLVGVFGGLEWPQLLILTGLAVVVLVATGIIDLERIKKWKAGDR